MPETIQTLPKNDPDRLAVADQVRYARFLDRTEAYLTTRKLRSYIGAFAGLTVLFDYIKTIDDHGTVLDIGAGEGLALSELAHSEIGSQLDFIGTVLTPPKEKPPVKIINTSAENLFGIPNNSVTGIISCYGLGYSAAAALAARRIDEVLVPGAPLKATFHRWNPSSEYMDNHHGLQDAGGFLNELKKLDYDVAAQKHRGGEILLAIKPGGDPDITAADLLSQDETLYWESIQKEK